MSAELKEALVYAESALGLFPSLDKRWDIVLEAARRVAEADEVLQRINDAMEVWWCHTHEANGSARQCFLAFSGITCDMVPGRLLLPAEEEK